MRLIFITPPETLAEPGRSGSERRLADRGRRRARSFARSAVAAEVSAIWCSPSRDAIETAAALSVQRNISLRTDARLAEAGPVPTVARNPLAVFDLALTALPLSVATLAPVQETAQEAQARVVAALRVRVAAHRGGDLAIVSHGALGELLRCHLLGRPVGGMGADHPQEGRYWTADLTGTGRPGMWRPLDAAQRVRLSDHR